MDKDRGREAVMVNRETDKEVRTKKKTRQEKEKEMKERRKKAERKGEQRRDIGDQNTSH